MNDKNIFTLERSKSIGSEESKRRKSFNNDQVITEKILNELNQLKRAGSFQDPPMSSIRSIKSDQPKNKDFSQKILDEINQIRKSPPKYAKKLESMMRYIKQVKKRSIFIFSYPGAEKVSLPTGTKIFLKVVNTLKDTQPLEILTYNEEIKINVDKNNIDQKKLKEIIADKRKGLRLKYPYFTVNLDIITNPVVSAVMQLVDDNPFQGQRRDAILNKNFTNFAVTQFQDRTGRNFNLVCFA